jgi:signal transduction histidine kinase
MTAINKNSKNTERHNGNSISRILAPTHPSIVDRELKRRSQLLAWLTLALSASVLSAIGLVAILYPHWFDDPDMQLYITGALLLMVSHCLNRAGFFRSAALMTVVTAAAVSTIAPFLPLGVPQALIVTVAPILLTALIYSPQASVPVAVASVFISAVLVAFVPVDVRSVYVTTLLCVTVIDSIVLVFMHHQQALDRKRRQELAEANQDLRRSEAQLEQRVLERTRELEKARLEAEQANRLKTQFLANVSHEVRTPLNAIINFNQFVSSGLHGKVNEEQRDALTKATDSARHLLSLINDVLDMSRIETGHLDLSIEEDVDLAPDIREVATTTQALLEGKPVELLLEIPQHLPRVDVDRRRIRQVLLNLTSNAVKFTQAGSIELSVSSDGDCMIIAVKDTGTGVAADMQSQIFEPFVQLRRDRGSKPAGTGLGLAISRRLVEAHGGTLWIESEMGQGSTLFVSIPVRGNNGNNDAET